MTDVQEEPAVPPFDPQGDPRAGYLTAGGVLIFLGWGLAVIVNLLLHQQAPAGGERLLGVYFGRAMGDYAWATFGLGVFAGLFGVALLRLGRGMPKGSLVLPGYDY